MLGPLPARTAAVSQFHITTQDDLPGPDGDEPYVMFVNQTEYGNARFLRTNVFSARPDRGLAVENNVLLMCLNHE